MPCQQTEQGNLLGWNHLYQRARYRDNDFVSGFNTMLLKMTHLNNDLDFNVNDDSNDKRVYFDYNVNDDFDTGTIQC